MQTNHLNISELADFLANPDTIILDVIDHGTTRTHVAEFNGQDVLVFSDSSGNATVVYRDCAFDAESGGSIHDHARACLENA